MAKERFDKIIANQFNVSRKEARIAIRRGKATVHGDILRDPSALVDVDSAIVFEGQALDYKKYIYILMNKPKGVLSASSDKNRRTVVDLVPEKWQRNGLFPVGRLDKDTTGFLIITDDGDFAHKAIAPNKDVLKTYEAVLDGDITEETVRIFSQGVVLADGIKCKPAMLKRLSQNKVEIRISEGKYHQIKRMFGTVDLGVNELKRTAMGCLELPENMRDGECILLNDKEISEIFHKC